jgi:hypothetical protein
VALEDYEKALEEVKVVSIKVIIVAAHMNLLG